MISPDMLEPILRQIRKTQEIEILCDETFRLLAEFTEMAARGEKVSEAMPLVQQHIEVCPDCREEFEAVLEILKALPNWE